MARSPEWRWVLVAALAGLLIASPPFPWSVALIGITTISLLVLIEPALAVVVMLVVAPLKALIETEIRFPLPLDIGQIAFLVAVATWGTHKISQRERWLPLTRSPVLAAILVFLAGVLLTLPGAYNLSAGLNETIKWVEILLLAYIVADFAGTRWQWLLLGVVLAGATQALLGLYEFRGGSGVPHLWILDFRYFRAFGSFGQPNPFGAFMGLILPLALGTTWGYLDATWHNRLNRSMWVPCAALALVYAICSVIILAGLIASWSRGAWMGFAAAAVVLIWLAPLRLWQGTLLLIGLGIVASTLWVTGRVPPQLSQRFTDFSQDFTGFGDVRGVVISDENYAVVERLAHWQSAIEMSKSHPWLGVGFGNYEAAYPKFALINWPLALGHAHNYYLNLMAETGVVGVSVYVIMWLYIAWITWYIYRRVALVERGIALGLMGTWTHLAVHSLFDKLYVNNMFLHIGVMLGLLAVLYLRMSQTSD